MDEEEQSEELTEEQQGLLLFIQALAATFVQVDRQPTLRCTTAVLRRYVPRVLTDVGTNQGVSQRCLAQARELNNILEDAVDMLLTEHLLDSFDPPELE